MATILIAACEALHHAHEQGVVHRDVTPANLLVSYDGIVKLADFGIAKSQAVASHAKTNTGTLKGKIPYMSPEQARARSLDRRSDLFSLGVVAWELLTGRRLFHRRNELDMLRAVQMCDVPPLLAVRPDLPPALAAAVETALEPTVDDRWETAAEFEQALRAWLDAAGETASKSRLAKTMTRLFGRDAAERRLRAETASTESTAMNTPLPAPMPPRPDSSPHDFGEAAAIAFRADGTPEPRRSPLHPERWIPQIAMHLHLPPPRMPPLRMVGPLFALLLSAGGLVFGFHAQRHATRALDASMLAPVAAAPVAAARCRCGSRAAAAGAEAACRTIADISTSRRSASPCPRRWPRPTVGRAAACAKATHPRPQTRSPATETSSRGMMIGWRVRWPTSSAWRSTSSGSPS